MGLWKQGWPFKPPRGPQGPRGTTSWPHYIINTKPLYGFPSLVVSFACKLLEDMDYVFFIFAVLVSLRFCSNKKTASSPGPDLKSGEIPGTQGSGQAWSNPLPGPLPELLNQLKKIRQETQALPLSFFWAESSPVKWSCFQRHGNEAGCGPHSSGAAFHY